MPQPNGQRSPKFFANRVAGAVNLNMNVEMAMLLYDLMDVEYDPANPDDKALFTLRKQLGSLTEVRTKTQGQEQEVTD